MIDASSPRPGLVGRFRSHQSGHPSGLIGRIFGRAMVKDTAAANDQALALLDLDPQDTVLEVGFGQGRTAAVLIAHGHRVMGVDSSLTMVKQATARNRAACRDGRADLRLSDGVTIPFDDGCVDAAFSVHTIYFMADPAATLAEIARVLRPGGRLVLACRTGDTAPPGWMDPTVYRLLTSTQIADMLIDAGFALDEHHDVASSHEIHLFEAQLPALAMG